MKKEFLKKLTIIEERIIFIQKFNGQIFYIKQVFIINYQ